MEATLADANTILEVRDLKTYFFLETGTVRAVDGVNFSLNRKTTLGLVGESGCGKSITAMSIMRLIQSPPGKIVDGQISLRQNGDDRVVDIAKLDPRGPEIRNIRGGRIAMVFQEPMTSLNPLYTVGSQIAESVQLHQKVGRKGAMERALEMLSKVQISSPKQRLHEYPHQLSGGMRQRAMIALALSCTPTMLIADEPTTALDVTTEAQILDLMRELQADIGMSIMFITHNLGVIAQMCDEVAVMYLGQIVERAPVDNLFFNPKHPYTTALLESVPHIGSRSKDRLASIRGMVPDPYSTVPGCPFHPRCDSYMPGICDADMPAITPIEPEHYVRCYLYE
jgi:oligopeptide/dipeptide ABC transporter ATP-binding protein